MNAPLFASTELQELQAEVIELTDYITSYDHTGICEAELPEGGIALYAE